MRRALVIAAGTFALAVMPASGEAKPGYCRSGDPDVTKLIGSPLKCPGVRKVLHRWQAVDRCGVRYDSDAGSCSFRVPGGRYRWRCTNDWIDTYEDRNGASYGEFEVNCWVPRLVKPHERWVDFTVFD